MIGYLCKVAKVSRSGYYNFFSQKAAEQRERKEKKDLERKGNILKAFNLRNRKKGAKQIKGLLQGEYRIVYNLKSIRRIMKKYNIICTIRKPNILRKIMKATQEHRVVPNLLNRNFKQEVPGKVLLTDITYLSYDTGKRAYLSTIKDGSTNEILAYHVSNNIRLDIVMETIKKLKKNPRVGLTKDAFIHSDQGSHYTSPIFQKLLKKHKLGQSMSRRGNCWDNAPQESFFGHMKDELHLKECKTFDDLKKEIKSYMIYYNNLRYQWNLKRMTPVQYRNHLLQVA